MKFPEKIPLLLSDTSVSAVARQTLIKQKMLLRAMSVRGLAKQIGHHESVVSKSINHGRFPRVRAKIEEVLA